MGHFDQVLFGDGEHKRETADLRHDDRSSGRITKAYAGV
jgi:hypothetical protein